MMSGKRECLSLGKQIKDEVHCLASGHIEWKKRVSSARNAVKLLRKYIAGTERVYSAADEEIRKLIEGES